MIIFLFFSPKSEAKAIFKIKAIILCLTYTLRTVSRPACVTSAVVTSRCVYAITILFVT